jgi:Flp pilus assembly protein TadG
MNAFTWLSHRIPARAARRGAGKGERRNRRGAVVMLVGILMVLLMTFAAITLEASRVYETKSELQTAADAASLAGAIELLRRAPEAVDSARVFGSRNSAGNAKVTSMDITTGTWSATLGAFTPALPLSSDAVRVTTHQNLQVFFSRLLGDTVLTVSATATAWSSAPVVETNCIKPFAIPYQVVKDIIKPAGPTITDEDFRRLDDMTLNNQAATRFGLNFGQDWATDTTSLGARNRYYAIDMPPVWQEATGNGQSVPLDPSGAAYSTNIRKCSAAQVQLGDSLRVDPSNRVDSTIANVPRFCTAFSGGVCYGPLGFPGMVAKAVFFDGDPTWDGSGTTGQVGVKLVGSFMIDSVYMSGPNKGRIAGRLRTTRDYGRIGKTPTSLRRPVLVQ